MFDRFDIGKLEKFSEEPVVLCIPTYSIRWDLENDFNETMRGSSQSSESLYRNVEMIEELGKWILTIL